MSVMHSGDTPRVGVRHYLVKGRDGMPKIETSGIYRNKDGHAFFLRKDAITTDEILAEYALDAEAESYDAIAGIVASESSDDAAPVFGEDVTSVETDTVSYPETINEPAEPVAVAPQPASRRKRQAVNNRAEPAFENRSLDDSDGDGKSDADEAEDADI